jgi:FkbM family methyltransferase
MRNWKRRLLQWCYYRLAHTTKFPKGDLLSFLLKISQQGFRPTHVLDVGANRGKWSRKFRTVFPECSFTLVEPQIEMKPHLEKFCRRSQGSCWINAGAGSLLGQLHLSVDPNTFSSSFALTAEQAEWVHFQRRVVPMVTLDHLAAHVIGVYPEVVKISAEGFEAEVMKGAKTLIGKTELFLLRAPMVDPPSHWHSLLEIISMMDAYGYLPFDFTSFYKRPVDRAVVSCDIAFARHNGALASPAQLARQAA